jgi:prepilin peptidase CpaA
MPPDLILCAILIIAASTDLAGRRIPNLIPLAGLALALLLALSSPLALSLLDCVAGALAGLLLFLPLYMLRGMAAGDVKLMAAVGAFVGPAMVWRIGVTTFIVGGLMAALMLVVSGRLWQCLNNLWLMCKGLWQRAQHGIAPAPVASVGGIPYAVAIALSTIGQLSWQRW